MALDWHADLNREADLATEQGLRNLATAEREDLARTIGAPKQGDRIVHVQRTPSFPVRLETARHFRDPLLVVWNWRVLMTAKQAAREGWRVQLTVVTPKRGDAYVKAIERLQ